ncbi:MAG: radical SAM protein [Myxococcota bacterium]
MKVALIYPPPWKIAGPDEACDYGDEGPPPDYRPGDLDGDFYQLPYGLLSLGAQAMAAGYDLRILNLSSYRWTDVERVLAALDADLFGMSCWTANRRGVGYAAELIKQYHPTSSLVVGGPHAAPLARYMLKYHPAIDVVTTGESDQTFLEMAARRLAGAAMRGLAGAWYRTGSGDIEQGPERSNLPDLDGLVSPQRYFTSHIYMTSRGCPWACTFCGAESQWGRGFRGHSVDYVLDSLEALVERLPVKTVLIKDDTFTTNRKRVIALCRGIRERGLRFSWSCDTRVDLLTDELLREMRLAGCERLSLGVESGAPDILRQVDKKITVDDIFASNELAQRYGIKTRFYMMLGNRGETTTTFRQTLRFLERARPNDYIFSCLSIYPGTRDFKDAHAKGWVEPDVFFREPFQEYKVPFDADQETTELMTSWFADHSGLQRVRRPDLVDCRAVLSRLPDHPSAHLDNAGAAFAARDFDLAARHAQRALDLGHPHPGLALNYLACIAVERGQIERMMDLYSDAARRDPQHYVLVKNVNAARQWFRQQGPERGLPLELDASHEFQLLEKTEQPTLPGPLGDDFADFVRTEPAPEDAARVARLGSHLSFGDPVPRRLSVISS